MKYRIDIMRLREGTMTLNGWVLPKEKGKKQYVSLSGERGKKEAEKLYAVSASGIRFSVADSRGNLLPLEYVPMLREDVAAVYHREDPMCGFDIRFPYRRDESYVLKMEAFGERASVPVNEAVIAKRNSVANRKKEHLLALCNKETVKVAWDFFRQNGLRALWKKSIHKLEGIEEDYDYSEWYEKTKTTEAELRRQSREYRKLFPEGALPLFSIVIPAFRTPEKYLRMLLESLKNQTYPEFEVIVADGSAKEDETVRRVMEEYRQQDSRFIYKPLAENLGFSGNTNEALKDARGGFIALCDHDDTLTPDALYQVAKAVSEHPEAQFLYTDEDKVDFDGLALFEPHFKSDFNPDLLRSVNYICHLSVIRRDLLDRVRELHPEGLAFDPAYDGAQDHDFFLRCTEEAVRGENGDGSEALWQGRFTSERVIHIPKVCYHWRCHKNSTSANPASKLYAFDAGKRAVLAHEKRCGIPVSQVVDGITYGFYHTIFPASGEKVSVIIPNKDHTADLDTCIRSLIQRSMHRNLEFIVVENNSTEPETFSYYEKIQGNPAFFLSDFQAGYEKLLEERKKRQEYCELSKTTDTYQPPVDRERLMDISQVTVRVIRWDKAFNYSAINNFGVQSATGAYLLFLNNDVELINPDTLTEMLGYASRPDVGAVGARLLYEDDTVQHAGVVVGFGGIAGGCFIGTHEKENSYMHRMMCAQDYSAVTAACLMTKRQVFDRAGGFTEELAVAFNDIDFCMKVRAQGLLCVYDPYALLHHYESKSRGLEDTPEKVERFNGEIAEFASRWPQILQEGDPYYNPNLTLRKSNFALRDLSKEQIGEPFHLELDVEKQLREVRKARNFSKT